MTIAKGRRRLPGTTVAIAAAVLVLVGAVVVGGLAWVGGGQRQMRDIVEPVKVPDLKVGDHRMADGKIGEMHR